MKHYALFHYPMMLSLSPRIHEQFALQSQIPLHYTQIAVAPPYLKQAIQRFRHEGGQGANVTMPLKEIAFALCDKTTPRAQQAQSVNTLFWDKEEALWGDNTDGVGFVAALKLYPHLTLQNQSVLILGAGGAAAGILSEIIHQKPSQITIANRSLKKAQALVERFSEIPIAVCDITDVQSITSQWIINTTPLQDPNHDFPLTASQMRNVILYELHYSRTSERSLLGQWALQSGAYEAIDGLGMLIAQAAESFKIWHPNAIINPQALDVETILHHE